MSKGLDEFVREHYRACMNCGVLSMTKNDDGTWQCNNPDCKQEGVRVQLDNTLRIPTVWPQHDSRGD